MRSKDGRAATIRLRFSESARIGPGKIALLEGVGRSGSLERAGAALGMSGRRAALLVESVNEIFDTPVVEPADDGGDRLTALGEALVAAFRETEQALDRVVAERFAELRKRMR
ncbi:MAG: ModE family transcriptional regulator [Burkholderiaceae bacterium]